MAEGFAAIPTWMFREHERVSLWGVMVFGALATRAGLRGNFPSQATLAAEARCSERKVRDALRELEELGVVERVRRGGRGEGRLPDGYRLMDRPLNGDEEQPARGAGRGRQPAPGDRATGTSEQTTPLIEVDREEVDNPLTPKGDGALVAPSPGFDEWWAIYPLKKDKGTARRAFSKATKKVSVETLIEAARAYREDPNRVQAFTKYPASWLNAEAWENGPLPSRVHGAGSTAAERMAQQLREDGDERAIEQ